MHVLTVHYTRRLAKKKKKNVLMVHYTRRLARRMHVLTVHYTTDN